MDARLLDEILDKGWKTINATENARVIAQKGLILGDLCAGAGYPHRALECWFGALEAVEYLDYDWTFTPLNHRYYRFDSVVSMDECKELGRRIDSLWRRLASATPATIITTCGWTNIAVRCLDVDFLKNAGVMPAFFCNFAC